MPTKINLLYAKTGIHGGNQAYLFKAFIEVEKSAGKKQVILHYTDTLSNLGWRDKAASYLGPLPDNRECWVVDLAYGSPGFSTFDLNIIFAVRYVDKSGEYWDSNDGNNYTVAIAGLYNFNTPHYLLKSVDVALNDATVANKVFSGRIAVKNIAYQKVVKVLFTTDNWVANHEISAVYNSSTANGDELWTFNTPVAETVKNISFAVSCLVNEITYWDNNCGLNYAVKNPGELF